MDGRGTISEVTLSQQAQVGFPASLKTLMTCHDGLVQAVMCQQVLLE